MRFLVSLSLLISAGLCADSFSARGPRIINPKHVKPSALQHISDRGPASISSDLSEQVPFIHFDPYGLIVQSDGDGGDTAQRTGMFYFVYDDREAFESALDKLEIRPGTYVRHPHQGGFRSDPKEFSRDQQRALVIAMGAYGMEDRLTRMAKAHAARLGKYQNKDFIGPSHVGEYIRAFKARSLYPVLLLTDTVLLANSIRIVVHRSYDPDHTDDNNHIMSLAQSRYVMPTPCSFLARKIYKMFRPKNPGNTALREVNHVQGALSWYHRAESGGNPFIAESYREIVEDL